jgi:SAM-dependent methyltransferase
VSDWFDTFFTGAYNAVQRNTWTAEQSDADAAHVERVLALAPGSRILDAPCGAGRITLPLARRGHVLTGVDFNPVMLADARRAAGELAITYLERDMRRLDDVAGFDAAINFWGSFGYFDDAGNAAFCAAVCRALRPGGQLLIEGHVAETLLPRFQPRGWTKVGATYILEDRSFDTATSRLEVDWIFLGDTSETKHISMRLY